MKKISKSIVLLGVMLALFSCENQPIEFEDFGKTACYFPYQSPARTIILGNYDEGFNDNDNNHQFEIGVIMSGVYENKEDRKVYFELDTTLMSTVANAKYLPSDQYTIETASPVIIPKGDTKGRIKVKLTDAFFNDPKNASDFYKSTGVVCNYAIPLKITKVEGLDTILVGLPVVANPKRIVAADWKFLPKDYTLFGVKYINQYHGYYLRRGADKLINTTTSAVLGTKTYRGTYVENSEVAKAQTLSMNSVTIPSIIRRYNAPDGGALTLKAVFASDKTCIVYNNATNEQIGTGILKEKGDMWGGKPRDVIYLDYAYTDAPRNERHEVRDTMVIRDRGVGFELFIPTLKP
ncbi:MAG: DUF5627 domain-containing protein [Paludibacter sp.]|jgi:hypothetical protein|nr:DUF5627 domain-containing protein [Paludibacter sp.]